ncbi:MAG: hypothetical protein KG003_08300 [Bacteroidetes bacterium]|nr:hypothetical protein [Bacteroidota bacterium]
MKKIFTYTFSILLLSFCGPQLKAQNDSIKSNRILPADTGSKLNMDAIYNRPFLMSDKIPIAIGGYLEANSNYEQTDGASEGLTFQARRLTIFMSSTIAERIHFLSEIEFEDGTKEINIEFAAMDIEFHPLLNLRGGIVMNPIGAFNQNHDGPKWDFIDRPISATTLIPSTWSNVGFGMFGKYYVNRWTLGYEAYFTNGLNSNIISNSENRTSFAATKLNPNRFEDNPPGSPVFTGKIAIRNRKIGEMGISYLTGVYNQWKVESQVVDTRRNASIFAIDFNTSLFKNKFHITGEWVRCMVDVPETYTQAYGKSQSGAYTDFIYTFLQRKIGVWKNAKFQIGTRLEYVDYNEGKFKETGTKIYDQLWSIMPSLAFRPTGSTVLRLNYRYMETRDLLGNPAAHTGAIQCGFSTYF